MSIRRFSFIQLDVFAARALEGNPLAVFPDARGLTDAEMQAIAREMNLSETTFILPRPAETEREHGVRVRIFTVAQELPFAGHPALGTAAVIHAAGGGADADVRLELGVGTIPVSFREENGRAFGEMRQRDPELGAVHDPVAIARAAGLPPDDLAPDLPVQTVSTGLPFTIVPLRSLDAIQRLRLDVASAAEYSERSGGGFFYFVSRETVHPAAKLHVRMIFYGGEDPATGSAAGCCAAWAVAHGVIAPGAAAMIEQGLECGRPSRIFVSARREDGRITDVRVGGHSVEVARGELFL
jgi:trans-2,3-dihydro-3-hydroxyanthranilate isomerase